MWVAHQFSSTGLEALLEGGVDDVLEGDGVELVRVEAEDGLDLGAPLVVIVAVVAGVLVVDVEGGLVVVVRHVTSIVVSGAGALSLSLGFVLSSQALSPSLLSLSTLPLLLHNKS